ESYGKVYSFKRDREDKDKDEDLLAGSNQGLKKRKTIKEAGPSKGSKSKESSTNAFEEHSFEQFSPFKNTFSLPHFPMVTPIDDTVIFGDAYNDDVLEEEVDMNNVDSSYVILEATKFLNDHPQEQNSDGIFISQDKYVAEILKKFDFVTVKIASTLMEANKPFIKDEEAKDVDVHLYRSMIGSLIYLTTSRPGITFAVCACARLVIAKKGRCFVDTSEVTTGNTLLSTAGLTNVGQRLLAVTMKNRQSDMATAKVKRVNDQEQIQALVDKQKVIITEDSIRSDLRFDDAEGTVCLLNEAIFEGLTRMGAKTTAWNEFSSTMASAIIYLADNQKFNFSKYIFDTMVKILEGRIKFYLFLRFLQVFLDNQVEGMARHNEMRKQRKEVSPDKSEDKDHVFTPFSDPLPSGEDSYTLHELMVFYTNLQEQVFDLQEAKDAQSKEIAALKKKVSKLLKWRKSRSGALRRLIKIGSEKIDHDDEIELDADTQERKINDEMFGVDDLFRDEVVTTVTDKVSAAPTTDVTEDEIIMAQALAALKSVKPKVVVQEQEVSTTIPATATTVTTAVPTPRAKDNVFHEQKQSHIPTVSSSKDKVKAKLIEPEVLIKKKDQMRMDEEYAIQLEAEEQEAIRLSRAQQNKEANISWDNTQAMIEADSLLAERLQARKREEFSEEQKARLLGRSYDEVKNLFDREMRKVNSFIAMDLEVQKSSGKEAQESSTKRTTESLESYIFKKQKVDENVDQVIDDTEELKKCMEIVPVDGDEVLIEATPISFRSPTIIDYKIHKEGKKNYFKIIRADGNSQVYQTSKKMFKNFNREDVEVLWAIVKDRFKKEKPMDDMDNLMFRTLKTMFEHHSIIYYLLVEKVYPLTRSTLYQLWNDVRLQVDYDVEMTYDLLRFIRKQLMEGSTP
nr:hypothetical protein [Tanacetum cinerariifolium]